MANNVALVTYSDLPELSDDDRLLIPSLRRFGGVIALSAEGRPRVRIYGGTVKAESPGVGQGATFTVELPVR